MQKMIRSFETERGTVVLREGNMADAAQFRDLRLSGLQDSPTAFSADYQLNFSHPMSHWESRLNFDGHGIIFFAEHDGKLIGMTGIRRRESPKTKHSADIFSVYIRPEWRGLRIAETFIGMCVEWARQCDVVILKLGVMTSNTSAIRCYERCGFKIYGTEPRDIFHEGKYYDLNLMYREI